MLALGGYPHAMHPSGRRAVNVITEGLSSLYVPPLLALIGSFVGAAPGAAPGAHHLHAAVRVLEPGADGLLDLARFAAQTQPQLFTNLSTLQASTFSSSTSDGTELRVQRAEVVTICTELADEGHMDAQAYLANIYLFGRGVKCDSARAVELYTQAALQGNKHSQNQLGEMYQEGHGCDQSYEEAVKWYVRARNAKKLCAIGDRYKHLGELDGEEAAYRAAIAADPGCYLACGVLGKLLQDKRNDIGGAEGIYCAAIEANPGNSEAHSDLGLLLLTGRSDLKGAAAVYSVALALVNDSVTSSPFYDYSLCCRARAGQLYTIAALAERIGGDRPLLVRGPSGSGGRVPGGCGALDRGARRGARGVQNGHGSSGEVAIGYRLTGLVCWVARLPQ